jgi:cobalt-zinc-cadmium efflux system outer membrane protein
MFWSRPAPFGAACLLSVVAQCAQSAPLVPPQSAGAAVIPPRLHDTLQWVWKSSPEVQAARAELEAARARARAAVQPIYNPALTLEAENADVDRRTAGISLALDLSGKRRARAEHGQAQLRTGEAMFDRARRDIAARWLKAWASAALATRQVELGQQRVELMQRFDDLAARRLKVGDISSPERDLAGLALGEAGTQQAMLIGHEAAVRAALLAIGGDTPASLPPLPDAVPPTTSEFEAKSVDDLPELREARARQESADAGIQIAQSARAPDPTVSLTGGRARSGPFTDRVIGLNVSIPLPVWNTGRAEVDAARADADAASASMQSRRLSLLATRQEAGARYDALRAATIAFRGSRAAAFEDRTTLLERLWRAGEIGTSDYLVQLKQSLDTALSGLELQSQAWQAWFDYLSASGRLTDWIDGSNQDTSQ